MISPFNLLLDRYKAMRPPDDAARTLTKAFLKEISGEEVELARISVRNGVLSVEVSGPLKTELFMKKQKLFALLRKELGVKAPHTLR